MTAEKKSRSGRKRKVREEDRAAHAQMAQGIVLQLRALLLLNEDKGDLAFSHVSLALLSMESAETAFSTKPTPVAA